LLRKFTASLSGKNAGLGADGQLKDETLYRGLT